MRRYALLSVLLVGLIGSLASASAQEATPAARGYPELTITATNTGFVVPPRVDAGRYLITFDNTGAQSAGMFFWRLPTGATAAEVAAALPTREPGSSGAAPAAFYEADLPGAPGYAEAGKRSQAIVDLAAGDYVVLTEEGAWATPIEVVAPSAATPAAPPEPRSDLTVTLQDYAFDGIPSQVAPGSYVWKTTNAGPQPHQMIVGRLPDGMTFDQVVAGFTHPPNATPPAGALRRDEFVAVGGLEIMSPGNTGWALLDLAPGTYGVVCLVPDRQTGMLHAAMGMVAVFTVGPGAATPPAS